LSAALFDQKITPLASTRRSAGAPDFFPRGADKAAPSYFETPSYGANFIYQGDRDAAALADAMAAQWTAEGEPALAALAPLLKKIAAALVEETIGRESEVNPLCYTLY
jgi:hypothetical protein